MSKFFVPVVDHETPRSERNDFDAKNAAHRQFDAPHAVRLPCSCGCFPFFGHSHVHFLAVESSEIQDVPWLDAGHRWLGRPRVR
jgi:hypothetical protein